MQTISTFVVYFTEPRLCISVVYSGSDVTSPEIAERKSTLRNLKNVHFEPDFYSIMLY